MDLGEWDLHLHSSGDWGRMGFAPTLCRGLGRMIIRPYALSWNWSHLIWANDDSPLRTFVDLIEMDLTQHTFGDLGE